MKKKYKVFISHSGSDNWIAKQIQTKIKNVKSLTFLDEDNIYAGDDFKKVIVKQIKDSSELLLLLTPWAKKNRASFIMTEVGCALANDEIRITPVLHGVTMKELKSSSDLSALATYSAVELNDIENYFKQLKTRTNGKK